MSIEMTHAENNDLIEQHNIVLGSMWELKNKDLTYLPKTALVSSIHGLYGWIRVNNRDTNVPQRVRDFMNLYRRVF